MMQMVIRYTVDVANRYYQCDEDQNENSKHTRKISSYMNLHAFRQRNNFHKIYHFVTLLLLSLCLYFEVEANAKKIQHKTAHGLVFGSNCF